MYIELVLLLISSLFTLCHAQRFMELARELETRILQTKIPDTTEYLPVYDYIIVGAGSAGCVMASRLSEISNASVLLLEAGDQETFLSDVPLTAALTQMTGYNWGYRSQPTANACRGLSGGVCNWPKGRGVGGTSLINYMIYTRGHRRDYEHWAELGNIGWNYSDVLPYFRKSENIGIPELLNSPYHGRGGGLDVQHTPYQSVMLNAFLRAGTELGYNISDTNGALNMGFSRAQATLRNGRRCSTSKAFIRPAMRRPNLHISMHSWVTRILIDPETRITSGVQFIKNRNRYTIRARREVILSAGAIASPQLLMLSGVGPRDNLEEFEIPVIQDLKVGYNLQDHVGLNGLAFVVNVTTINDYRVLNPVHIMEYIFERRGPYTIPGGAEAYAFVRTPNSSFGKFAKKV